MALKQSLAIELEPSHRLDIKAPAIGERVGVAGETGEFMVVRVDRERHLADLMRMTGARRRVEPGVPLYALRAIGDRRREGDEEISKVQPRSLNPRTGR